MSDIIIDVKNLEKQYMKQKAVRSASFSITEGMICGLIGPNGAGKTTIMKMRGGLVLPTGGSISIYGGSSEKELAEARSRMSFMIETPYAKENLTARENLEKQRIQKGIPDKKQIDRVLELVGLENTEKKPVKAFSLGMRQRLGLANALMSTPEIMVLDEPINGLDPQGIIEMRELILRLNREHGITVLISSHILDELSRLATWYGFIDRGHMVKELSAEELENLCRKYIRIEISDTNAFSKVMDRLGAEYRILDSNHADLYSDFTVTELVTELSKENCTVVRITESDETLESFYMNLIGGDRNA